MSVILRQNLHRSSLIVAFDGLNPQTYKKSIRNLAPFIAGGKATELLEEKGAAVLNGVGLQIRFMDAKLNDIPDTMRRRVAAYAGRADVVTVHLSSGRASVEAAVAEAERHNIGIVGVTVLTSLSPADCRLLYKSTIEEQVARLTCLAQLTGVYGIVCSAHENHIVRREFRGAVIFNPGIRFSLALSHDQARLATPADAIRMGADFLVCGRQIMLKPTPAKQLAEVMRINAEVAAARRLIHHE